ncbi:MAG: hypothetical protein WCW14_03245 [Candidatus Paceibacterota bacterium]|jgi:hypothetical protein
MENSLDKSNEARFLHKLEHEYISREIWEMCISAYVQAVLVRPWLAHGSVTHINQLQLWHPLAQWGIVLKAGKPCESLSETLLHELIHISLRVIGIEEHTEESVERLCKILALKYPYIVDVFMEVFPGLMLDDESLEKAFREYVYVSQPIPAS